MSVSFQRLSLAGALLLGLLGTTITSAAPHAAPAARVTAVQGKIVPNNYIVVLKEQADARAQAALANIQPKHIYAAALKGFAAELTAKQLEALQHNPNVAYIEPDQQISADATQAMDANGDPWGLDRIDQRARPLSRSYTYYASGSGVTAYVIDTGLQANHPDFGSRAQNVFDAFGGSGADCDGHGTHVAGTVGGTTYGVAKSVQLRGVRVLDCNGDGTVSSVVAGVDWVRANAVKPAVANMSLGGGASSAINTAVANLVNSGVFVAVAAGNENQNACNVSPASTPEAYTVAASDKNDVRASFSNFGTCVDIYAPGVAIKSASLNSGTHTEDGTSMASPHVAGVAALYKSTYGDTSAGTISAWLTTHATPNVISSNASGTPNRLLYLPTSSSLSTYGGKHSADFDGDRKADFATWRVPTGEWRVRYSSTGALLSRQWGQPVSDVPVPGDYDGDGKTDLAVWRPSTGQWFHIRSSDGATSGPFWGDASLGDMPVPGDYDGDRKTDFATWRVPTGEWRVRYSSTGALVSRFWGQPVSDVPVPADYDGDGKTDLAVYRPQTGQWFHIRSSDGATSGPFWGSQSLGDVPTPGDYDGDGKTDFATWRVPTGEWRVRYSSTGALVSRQWGQWITDVPVAADYDGDGKTDLAVWRPSTGQWFHIRSSDSTSSGPFWGDASQGDVAVPSGYVRK